METQSNMLSDDLKKDLERNREGRLSTRQWIELITEPLATLLLLSVPLILVMGRYGVAGRLVVLLVVLGFAITIILRAIRFARVKLYYRVLYVEHLYPRWMVWRKTKLMTKSGDPIQFNHQLTQKLPLQNNQAVMVYYIDVGDRRVLVSLLPEKHPVAISAIPTDLFTARNGVRYTN